MKLPSAEAAIIAPEKLRDYLLDPEHRRGGSKARLLHTMGYCQTDWSRLDSDIRSQHLPAEVAERQQNEYGEQFVIAAPLTGPNGRTVLFRSVWQIDLGAAVPRLITMYPE